VPDSLSLFLFFSLKHLSLQKHSSASLRTTTATVNMAEHERASSSEKETAIGSDAHDGGCHGDAELGTGDVDIARIDRVYQ
jgi:hypothetical protein